MTTTQPGVTMPVASANPLLVPPPGGWIEPDTAPMHPSAVLLVGPVTAFYILALAAIILRVWSRRMKKFPFQLSDYAVFIAAAFGTAYVAICWTVADRGGLGYPLVQVAPAQRLLIRKAYFAGWLLQSYANTFVRLSILEFIKQVFHSVRRFRLVVYLVEAATVAYILACTIAFFATCRPFSYNWSLSPDTPQHCGNLSLKFLLSAIFNLVLDVSILILPMPMLWTLQMDVRKKAALSIVFGLGIFVCFATAWRTYHVVKFSTPAAQMNFTVTIVEDALWSGLEITLGIINACLPVMQPALQRIFDSNFLQLITFSSIRSRKNSKISSETSTSSSYSRYPYWRRFVGSKEQVKSSIDHEAQYSTEFESESRRYVPLETMEPTPKLVPQDDHTGHM